MYYLIDLFNKQMAEQIVQAITQDLGTINFDQLRFKSCGNWIVVLELTKNTKPRLPHYGSRGFCWVQDQTIFLKQPGNWIC